VKKQTLLEFLKPVSDRSRKDICLAAMSYLANEYHQGIAAPQLKAALVAARFPKAKQFNVADVLGKAGELVSVTRDGRSYHWSLSSSGDAYIAKLLGLDEEQPEVKNTIAGLSSLLSKISDDVVKGYVEESLTCFKVDARRASVVFLWSGAMRCLQDKALTYGIAKLNGALAKHDPKAKHVGKVEDFSSVKDVTQLLAFRELGQMDKGQWQTLQEGLDLRNRCGHPTKYRPGTSKVAAFIEDIIGIAF
jgi:hypothetical protein